MPPKTRGTKTAKASKENICVVEKPKLKGVTKPSRPRKALADKTNSASDDNASTEIPKKVVKKTVAKDFAIEDNKERPRRERRLPNRFIENEALKNLSNSKEVETVNPESDKSHTSNKNDSSILSPFKTPQKDADNSLLANRPRRVCRLPSKFDDHSVSPNKFIPVGCHASTPILPNKGKSNVKATEKPTSLKVAKQPKLNKKIPEKEKIVLKSPIVLVERAVVKSSQKVVAPKSPVKKLNVEAIADTNNNARKRLLRTKNKNEKVTSPKKVTGKKPTSPKKTSPVKTAGQKLLETSFSFRVLEDKKKSLKRDSTHLDVYEFTYDPNEEPPPQKKKRKKAVKRKPAKPKTVVFKNNYDQNVNKALAALKNVVSKNAQPITQENTQSKPQTIKKSQNIVKPQIIVTKNTNRCTANTAQNVIQEKNHVSVGIEDIAADIEPMDHHEINYSPVTSPNRGKSPVPTSREHSVERQYQDPLNLQECLSFFDEPPVASSSMNMSTRKPQDTPWRVQFEQLPIKWHVNTYVKANMTPAVESSFINFDDSKKKHVYTNMVPDATEDLPEIVENNQPNLKQTSIISFIKEIAQRSASKKKRGHSVTPTKANYIFEDISNISASTYPHRTLRKTPRKEAPENSTPNRSDENDLNNDNIPNNEDKENSSETKKTKKSTTPKEKNADGTLFGFDESEDLENVSPVKIDNPRVRALRPRARAVLQEINAVSGPTRAKLPLAAKTNIAASSDAVNKVYEDLKSATDAPDFPEKEMENVAATDAEEQMNVDEEDEDGQSVHLFEDIEVVHHLQPSRKSYGKAAKKVTFQASMTGSETQMNPFDPVQSDEDDLADLTFTMPNVQQKTQKKKKAKKKDNLSKKEKAELDAWAAGFNSMCEDIEEFPLLVE